MFLDPKERLVAFTGQAVIGLILSITFLLEDKPWGAAFTLFTIAASSTFLFIMHARMRKDEKIIAELQREMDEIDENLKRTGYYHRN